jgi:hypothetical protein
MKKQITNLAAALMFLSAPAFAQLTSSPLEQGLYDFMKTRVPASYGLVLVNDNEMTVAGTTRVDYISPEQITISGIVTKVSPLSAGRIRSMIDDYNFSAAVGTMKLDEKSGVVTMEHFINPKFAKLPEMSKAVTLFSDALRQQSGRFSSLVVESGLSSEGGGAQCMACNTK